MNSKIVKQVLKRSDWFDISIVWNFPKLIKFFGNSRFQKGETFLENSQPSIQANSFKLSLHSCVAPGKLPSTAGKVLTKIRTKKKENNPHDRSSSSTVARKSEFHEGCHCLVGPLFTHFSRNLIAKLFPSLRRRRQEKKTLEAKQARVHNKPRLPPSHTYTYEDALTFMGKASFSLRICLFCLRLKEKGGIISLFFALLVMGNAYFARDMGKQHQLWGIRIRLKKRILESLKCLWYYFEIFVAYSTEIDHFDFLNQIWWFFNFSWNCKFLLIDFNLVIWTYFSTKKNHPISTQENVRVWAQGQRILFSSSEFTFLCCITFTFHIFPALSHSRYLSLSRLSPPSFPVFQKHPVYNTHTHSLSHPEKSWTRWQFRILPLYWCHIWFQHFESVWVRQSLHHPYTRTTVRPAAGGKQTSCERTGCGVREVLFFPHRVQYISQWMKNKIDPSLPQPNHPLLSAYLCVRCVALELNRRARFSDPSPL